MGILIILIALIVVTIPLMVVSRILECSIIDSWYGILGTAVNFISLTTLICVGIPILCIQIPKVKNYEQKMYEKNVLEYRLENYNQNLIGNELIYNDIVEFNKSIRNAKRYSDNFWIGLFYNDKIAEIDYIQIYGVDTIK